VLDNSAWGEVITYNFKKMHVGSANDFEGYMDPTFFTVLRVRTPRAHASVATGMHSSSCFQRSRGLKKTYGSSGMREPACMLAVAAAAAGRCWLLAAAAGCCCWLMRIISEQ
jgi:hypothetical protein